MQKLEELIAALEKATGPSEELDVRIRCTLLAEDGAYVEKSQFNGAWCIYRGENRFGRRRLCERPMAASHELWIGSYTRSIDAAAILIGHILPNANCWGIDKNERGVEAHVQRNGVATGHWAQFAEHPTSPAIALCIAALRAKLSQENDNADK